MTDREEQYRQHEAAMTEDGYTLNPPGYERLISWTFIMHNTHFAAWAIERLLAEDVTKRGDTYKTYDEYARFSSMITAYGRCFVDGIKQLSANHIFKDEPALRAVHDRMMEIRHRAFAHGEESEFMRARIGVKEEAGKVQLMHYFTIMTPRGDFEDYSQVIAHVRRYVLAQLEKFVARKEAEIGKPIVAD